MNQEPVGARLFFEQLAPALTLHRKRRGLSAAELARRASIGKSQLSKYETGKELPKLETLAKLLNSLDLEPIWFFYTVHQMISRPRNIETALALDLASSAPARRLSMPEEEGFRCVFSNLLRLHQIVLDTQAGAAGSRRRSPNEDDGAIR